MAGVTTREKSAGDIKRAREEAADPMSADPTELLAVFEPDEQDLKKRGLPKDFLTRRMPRGVPGGPKCSNNTVLYMADFVFEV